MMNRQSLWKMNSSEMLLDFSRSQTEHLVTDETMKNSRIRENQLYMTKVEPPLLKCQRREYFVPPMFVRCELVYMFPLFRFRVAKGHKIILEI